MLSPDLHSHSCFRLCGSCSWHSGCDATLPCCCWCATFLQPPAVLQKPDKSYTLKYFFFRHRFHLKFNWNRSFDIKAQSQNTFSLFNKHQTSKHKITISLWFDVWLKNINPSNPDALSNWIQYCVILRFIIVYYWNFFFLCAIMSRSRSDLSSCFSV